MELCVLPNTGADAGIWAFVILAAVAAIVLGVVMLGRGASRRRIVTGMGALAAVGIVALGSVGAAPSAFADAGSSDCVTQPTRPAPPAAAPVTPQFPTAAAQCGVDAIVTVPTQDGVVYTQTREGNTVTVTATAAPGFVIPAGVQSVFQLDVTPAAPAPWPVALPERESTIIDDAGEDAIYLEPSDAELVPGLQAAADAEQLQYELRGEDAVIALPFRIVEIATGEVVARERPSVPFPSDFGYDFERNAYTVVPLATGDLNVLFDAVTAAFEAYDPELFTVEFEAPFSTFLPIVLDGFQIVASYDSGVCGVVTGVVTVDASFPELELPPVLDALPDLDQLSDQLDGLTRTPDAATSVETQQEGPTSTTTEGPAAEAPTSAEPAVEATTSVEPTEAPTVDETEAVVTQD